MFYRLFSCTAISPVSRLLLLVLLSSATVFGQEANRHSFNEGWKFFLGDADASRENFDDGSWRKLELPHDWSVELPFDSTSPTGTGGGALRGGLGWYRKTFTIPASASGKQIYIDFDGAYCNSEVFLNGNSLGRRPNGYISFRYDMTPYIRYGQPNTISVKVDNSQQPNSRWYSGSGIYRNVWLVTSNKVSFAHWGTSLATSSVSEKSANVRLAITLNNNENTNEHIAVRTVILDAQGKMIAERKSDLNCATGETAVSQSFEVKQPKLWSIDRPYLYSAVTELTQGGKKTDSYTTRFGIRYFEFDKDKGFFLNGKPVKIIGVCDHHDLGALGTAINTRALERQLQILKGMGCNGIRTSHNPPAPELLDLCDRMGFVVMDEAFDMWKKEKNKFDYHLDWDQWHEKDLRDQVIRDRNHPSVFIWSIGNEIPEQWGGKDGKDSSGITIAWELAGIIRGLDSTRPITSALNDPRPGNNIYKSGALDLVGFNYHHQDFKKFPAQFPGKKFIATETVSALQTRGHYDFPSDSIRRWPGRWDKPVENANPDLSCSAYDNCSAPWGSTHEETLKELLKYDFASGMFIWTGFDYLGEPTPYPWPARSSYFGIIDLAGFPKDVYYLYQSLFTSKPVLHLFPHWNWKPGQIVDLWAYYNNADEVELFLNGHSLGTKRKTGDELHIMWRVPFEAGTLRAVSRKNGKTVLEKTIHTAGIPARILLSADRPFIKADKSDRCFVTVKIVDKDGNLVPDADQLVKFAVSDGGSIVAVDNGSPVSMESFRGNQRKAFNGLCIAIIQPKGKAGKITLNAEAIGLAAGQLSIDVR